MRGLLLTALAVPGLLATPSHATSTAAVNLVAEFGCLGCGWTRVQISGVCAGSCNGVNCAGCFVSGSGEAYTSHGTCAAQGWMSADIRIGLYEEPLIIGWSNGVWSTAMGNGTTGTGVVTVSSCDGGAGTASFTGYLGSAVGVSG